MIAWLGGRIKFEIQPPGGARDSLQQFVAAVHEQVLLEHRQWLGTAESTQTCLVKFEEALASASAKLLKAESPDASNVDSKERAGG